MKCRSLIDDPVPSGFALRCEQTRGHLGLHNHGIVRWSDNRDHGSVVTELTVRRASFQDGELT